MSLEGIDRLAAYPDKHVRERVMEQARKIAGKAVRRLRRLAQQLPEGALESVERLHDDPIAERRKAARLADGAIPVVIRPGVRVDESEGAVRDHCPTGVGVLLTCPVAVGTLLRVRLPAEMGGWVTVEVKHCRKEEDSWVAGCELMSDQPPL